MANAALEAAQAEIRASQQAASSFVERAQQLVERVREEAALVVAATTAEVEEELRAAYAAATNPNRGPRKLAASAFAVSCNACRVGCCRLSAMPPLPLFPARTTPPGC